MAETLAQELHKTKNKAEKKRERAQVKESARRAAAVAIENARIDAEAAEQAPFFISALTEKLRVAAKEEKTSARIVWTTGIESNAIVADRAMEMAAEHFEAEGLGTSIESGNNAHSGPAHGELEIRDYFPATEWWTYLTAYLPK